MGLGGHDAGLDFGPERTVPPLPASTVAWWYAQNSGGLSTTAWVDRGPSAISVTGTGTPVVAADSPYFRGRVVAQAAITGSKAWRVTGLGTPLLTIGQRPWTMSIVRFRALPAAGDTTNAIIDFGISAVSDRHYLNVNRTAGVNVYRFQGYSLNVDSSVTPDTKRHAFKAWTDGTNINLQVDATLTTAVNAFSLLGNVTAVAIGTIASGVAQFSDTSHEFHLLCSSKPTATEEARLDAFFAAQG